MHIRKDGAGTREKILDAACQVFGDKGYRDSTNRDICSTAGVNIAAVNYHFGSKADLYRACLQHAIAQAEKLYPLHGGTPETAPAAQRLQRFITSMVHRHMDCRRLSHLHRIRMTEYVSSTGLLDDLMAALIKKNRKCLTGIIRELLGSAATEQNMSLCEMSVISQCLMRSRMRRSAHGRARAGTREYPADTVAEHVYRFSMAGIRSVKEGKAGRRQTGKRERNV